MESASWWPSFLFFLIYLLRALPGSLQKTSWRRLAWGCSGRVSDLIPEPVPQLSLYSPTNFRRQETLCLKKNDLRILGSALLPDDSRVYYRPIIKQEQREKIGNSPFVIRFAYFIAHKFGQPQSTVPAITCPPCRHLRTQCKCRVQLCSPPPRVRNN